MRNPDRCLSPDPLGSRCHCIGEVGRDDAVSSRAGLHRPYDASAHEPFEFSSYLLRSFDNDKAGSDIKKHDRYRYRYLETDTDTDTDTLQICGDDNDDDGCLPEGRSRVT